MSVSIALRRVMQDLRERRQEIEAVLSDLYLPDGSRRYSDNVHADRLKSAETLNQLAHRAVEDQINKWKAQAAALRRKAAGDPLLELDVIKLERASRLAPLVKDYTDRASLADLARTLDGVNESDDQVAILLYARYGRFRLDATGAVRAYRDGLPVASLPQDVNNEDMAAAQAALQRLQEKAASYSKAGRLAQEAAEIDAAIQTLQAELVRGEGSDALYRAKERKNAMPASSF